MEYKFDDFLVEMLKDPETKAEYDRLAPEYAIKKAVLKEKSELGLTQSQLAELAGIYPIEGTTL